MLVKTGLVAVIIGLCSVTATHASGHLPIIPTTQTFKTHSACVVALQGFLAEDRKRAHAERTDAKGDTQEVQLITKGLKLIDRTEAQYDGTMWFHYGRFRAELEQVEVSHSFEHRLRECDGNILRVSGDMGFTLSTFEPARVAGKSQQSPGAKH